jgi:C-terminal processing protease CtpA/Prc
MQLFYCFGSHIVCEIRKVKQVQNMANQKINAKTILGYVVMLVLGMVLLLTSRGSLYAKSSERGWLGISIREITPSLQKKYDLENTKGLLITYVNPNSPADEAGLQEDDVILKYDGKTTVYAEDFIEMVRNTAPDNKVKINVWRDGKEITAKVTIGKRGEDRGSCTFPYRKRIIIREGRPALGVQVQELNEDLAAYFKVKMDEGVLVTEVFEDTPAAKAEIKSGDVITKLDDKTISDTKTLIKTLGQYEDGDKVALEIVRHGEHLTKNVVLQGRALPEPEIFLQPFHHFRHYSRDDDEEIYLDLPELDSYLEEFLDKMGKSLERKFEENGTISSKPLIIINKYYEL